MCQQIEQQWYNNFFKDRDFGEGVTVSYEQFQQECDRVQSLYLSQPKNLFLTDPEFCAQKEKVEQASQERTKCRAALDRQHLLADRVSRVKWGTYLVTLGVLGLRVYSVTQSLPLSNWQNRGIALSLVGSGVVRWLATGAASEERNACFNLIVADNAIVHSKEDLLAQANKILNGKYREIIGANPVRCMGKGQIVGPQLDLNQHEEIPLWTKKEGYELIRLDMTNSPLLRMGEFNQQELLNKSFASKIEIVAYRLLWSAYNQRVFNFIRRHSEAPKVVAQADRSHLVYSKEAGVVHRKCGNGPIICSELCDFAGTQFKKDPVHQIFELVIRRESIRRREAVGIPFKTKDMPCGDTRYDHPLFEEVICLASDIFESF